MSIRSFLSTALATILVSGTAYATPLLSNGSFEANSQANGSWAIYNSLSGWSASPNVELRNNVAGAAQHGSNYVELDTTGNSAIFQNVSTTAGQNYLLTFWYSPRSGVAASSNAINVSWSGLAVGTVTGAGSGGGNVWQQFSYAVVGTGALTQLRFSAGGTSDSLGGSLDNVALTAVPEPGTTAIFLMGLGLLGWSLSRKQQ